MIEEKDASKSDERHVKDRRNTNLLTQKKTGGKDIMGNRGMTNWKLGAFFIMSLMLVAAVFSNAAMAQGPGQVTVGWNIRATATTDVSDPTVDLGVNTAGNLDPLAAGSSRNVLRFTYTAFNDVAGLTTNSDGTPQDDDVAGEVDTNDTAINMSGGRVRIAIPGWTVPNNLVTVVDNAGASGSEITLYDTAADGKQAVTDSKLTGRVSFSANGHIIVTLDAAWSSIRTGNERGRQLQITFGDATTPVPNRLDLVDNKGEAVNTDNNVSYAGYTFSASSATKGGNLRLLASSPVVRVGNILGTKVTGTVATTAEGRDTLSRNFDVTPLRVYVGEEDHDFMITFTAPGPMYGSSLTIALPAGLRPTIPTNGAAADVITVRASSGVSFVVGDALAVSSVPITLNTINKGQKIFVSYEMAEILTGATSFAVGNLETTMPGGNATAATTLANKGGSVGGAANSGRMQISPVSIEASSKQRPFTLTFTANTKLENFNLAITPAGINLEDNNPNDNVDIKLQTESSGKYGYVTGSVSSTASTAGVLTVPGNVITWTGVTLASGDKLTTTVSRVDVLSDAGSYTWEATLTPSGGTPTPIGEDAILTADDPDTAVLSVVKTSAESVKFTVDGQSAFPAASERAIVFKFTAESSPIRDGSVWFTIPSSLGSGPVAPKGLTADQKKVTLGIVGAGGGTLVKDQPTVSGRTVSVAIKRLDVGQAVTITYGTGTKKALMHNVAGDVNITGNFRTSSGSRPAGTAKVTITNVEDGAAGAVTISPQQVEAGSNHGVVSVRFTALGTMDSGKVSLELPTTGWGTFQRDPAERNYVEISGNPNVTLEEPTVDVSSNKAVAKITKLAAGQSFTFVYGGGSGGIANGAEVQDSIGVATFMIESDGEGDGVFAPVTSIKEQTATEKVVNPDKLGTIFKGAAGQLNVDVEAAADGTGTVVVAPLMVRAADDNVALTFTYTSTQTINDGELRFTVPSGWSAPQVSDAGAAGYTVVGGNGLGTADAPAGKRYITVPIISVTKGDTITITFGAADDGKAMAPAAVGPSVFTFAVRGTSDGALQAISSGSPSVTVQPQASGKSKSATAMVSDGQGALYAGQDGRQITVVYTAAGQMVQGEVQLTIPPKATTSDGLGWSAPTADNVTVTASTGGSVGTIEYGGSLAVPTQAVTADGVNLMSGGTLTFVYTGKVQPTAGDASFGVGTKGGLETDTAFVAVSNPADPDSIMLAIPVGEAKKGSGTAEIADADTVVAPGATGETITFTYTAVGEISYPREFRVRVPAGWSAPSSAATSPENAGTYSVEHMRDGLSLGNRVVEEITPVDRDMVARVKSGVLHVMAGDQIIITYENATAPATAGVTPFGVYFGGQTNDAQVESINVFVQSAMPSQLALGPAGTVSADVGAAPLAITVSLQDAAGMAAAMAGSTAVTLTSDSATGAFSVTADGTGTATLVVNIPAGMTSAMAYYSDSTPGTATITASSAGLTSDTQMVTVSTGVVAITPGSVTVSPALAKAGDTVTVSAMATPGQVALFSIGTIVTTGSMAESPSGTYSGPFTVVVDLHADGLHGVAVSLNNGADTEAAAVGLTIDSTAPAVTVTAPASAGNGDAVMISATVTEAGTVSSVTADVSALDSTQAAMVALTLGTDGSYSASVTISDDNAAVNGAKTITVTATDAAGNSGMGTASVMLDNKLSFTSMIPAGTSLFHVPLDVEGLDTVGNLKTMIGDGVSLAIVYDDATSSWNSRSDAVAITADLGIILSMTAEASVPFEGDAWGGGISMITLGAGLNLIGLPVNDPRVVNVSDIITLAAGAASSVVVSTADGFASVSAADNTADGPVTGDAAYLVTASSAATIPLLGSGWSNDTAGAAPIALAGYSVDGQTPVLDVQGAIVDEITGLAREGFRVKVKNLSTKASLSKVTSVETAEGYNMTFVDLKAGNAARVGDVLEISADSPNPLIGVQPVRHTVTVDDVKNSTIQLEELIAYEIPAETELLRNFPNPFNPETWIPYHLSEDADVNLTIYDISGEVVRDIDVGHQTAAKYDTRAKAIYWDGRNRFGEQVASGIYFYHLDAGDFSGTRKMVILK